MLSYQHIYHAGNLADLHKHAALARALAGMRGRGRPIVYFETHAGRGAYDLSGPESRKTAEAEAGWLNVIRDPEKLGGLPQEYVEVVRGLNGGALRPLYPGSPTIAARLLRSQDRLHLFELHPREHEALETAMGSDPRVRIYRQDGYEGVLSLVPPPRGRGLVLVDPSYEVKSEYREAARFVAALARKWPQALVLLWYPLLPAGRHLELLAELGAACAEGGVRAGRSDEVRWSDPSAGRGMYGSGLIEARGA